MPPLRHAVRPRTARRRLRDREILPIRLRCVGLR